MALQHYPTWSPSGQTFLPTLRGHWMWSVPREEVIALGNADSCRWEQFRERATAVSHHLPKHLAAGVSLSWRGSEQCHSVTGSTTGVYVFFSAGLFICLFVCLNLTIVRRMVLSEERLVKRRLNGILWKRMILETIPKVIHWGKRVFSQMVLEQLAIYRRGNKNVNHLLHCTKI